MLQGTDNDRDRDFDDSDFFASQAIARALESSAHELADELAAHELLGYVAGASEDGAVVRVRLAVVTFTVDAVTVELAGRTLRASRSRLTLRGLVGIVLDAVTLPAPRPRPEPPAPVTAATVAAALPASLRPRLSGDEVEITVNAPVRPHWSDAYYGPAAGRFTGD